jgi:hypothetical protein
LKKDKVLRSPVEPAGFIRSFSFYTEAESTAEVKPQGMASHLNYRIKVKQSF